MVTTIAGPGTSEADWLSWWESHSWPVVPIDHTRRVVVVAPHPDDEILGVGGFLALVGSVVVVAVTDGEASHPASTSFSVDELRGLRPAESQDALRRLGVDTHPLRLRHDDGVIDEPRLAAELAGILQANDLCLATWQGDGHPDHEAVGRSAAAACAMVGATLWEYPVWMWHWARPDDVRVPWPRAAVVALPPDVRARKAAAVAAFVTQVEPIDGVTILPEHVLHRFRRPFEVVFQ